MAYVPPEERREQFIAAATRVIRSEGLAKATTRRIAQEANAPLGSLHYCFRNKEELFEAVSQTLGDEGLQWAGENVRQGMGVRDATAEIMRSVARWIATTGAIQVGEFEFYVWGMRSETHGDMPKRVYTKWLTHVRTLLETAATDADAGIDLDAVSRTILALGDGFSLHDQILRQSAVIDNVESVVMALSIALDNGAFRVSVPVTPVGAAVAK
jgi:AcrR family transcriptional regulator